MSSKREGGCRYKINESFAKRILKDGIALRLHEDHNRGFVIARSSAPMNSTSFYDLVLEKTPKNPSYRVALWVNSGKQTWQARYRKVVGEKWLPKKVDQVVIPQRENDRGYVVIFKLQNVTDANIDRRYDEVVDVVNQIKEKFAECNFLN